MDEVYQKLASFFTRINMFDIDKFPLERLKDLSKELEGGKELSLSSRQIYDRIEAISKANVAKILQEKKERQKNSKKKEVGHESVRNSGVVERNALQFDNNLEYSSLDIDETVILSKPLKTSFKEIQKKEGQIYKGQLLILLQLSDLVGQAKIKAQFQINSRIKQSSITKETLAQLGLQSKNPSLLVDKRKQKFAISNKNILGLQFLQTNNIIIECNFRSQKSNFQMIYTQRHQQ